MQLIDLQADPWVINFYNENRGLSLFREGGIFATAAVNLRLCKNRGVSCTTHRYPKILQTFK